jgi:hypothetical protein
LEQKSLRFDVGASQRKDFLKVGSIRFIGGFPKTLPTFIIITYTEMNVNGFYK